LLGLRCACVCVRKKCAERITTELGYAIARRECVTALEVINVSKCCVNAVAECVIDCVGEGSFILRD
jgi:hypothetical protein